MLNKMEKSEEERISRRKTRGGKGRLKRERGGEGAERHRRLDAALGAGHPAASLC